MYRILAGLGASILMLSAPAVADPVDADFWIGIPNSDSGFLVDKASGEVWMTGICLKPLAKATLQGEIWTSRTVEQVSVGRSLAVLDQTLELQVGSGLAQIAVTSAGRGGRQVLPAETINDCQQSARCQALASVSAC